MTTIPIATDPSAGTGDRKIAKAFGLDGDSWMRHANPVSVWTRFAALPLVALAVWSRDWIGVWSVVPVALSLVWVAVNPRFFGVPRSTRNWASRAVLGERVWVDRDRVELPEQFRSRVPSLVANGFSTLGLGLLAYGLVDLDLLATVTGLLITLGGKAMYLDRITLLFAAVKDRPEYAAWDY
jgi:hypothetical protein